MNSVYRRTEPQPSFSDKAIMAYLCNMGGLSKSYGFEPKLLFSSQDKGTFGIRLIIGDDVSYICVKKKPFVDEQIESVEVCASSDDIARTMMEMNNQVHVTFDPKQLDLNGRINSLLLQYMPSSQKMTINGIDGSREREVSEQQPVFGSLLALVAAKTVTQGLEGRVVQ